MTSCELRYRFRSQGENRIGELCWDKHDGWGWEITTIGEGSIGHSRGRKYIYANRRNALRALRREVNRQKAL